MTITYKTNGAATAKSVIRKEFGVLRICEADVYVNDCHPNAEMIYAVHAR